MNTVIAALIEELSKFANYTERERAAVIRASAALRTATDEEVTAIVDALVALDAAQRNVIEPLVSNLLQHIAQRARIAARTSPPTSLSPELRDSILSLYNDLRAFPATSWSLLGWLAAARGRDELKLLAELLSVDPPADSPLLPAALGPLFQRADYDATALFPRLLDALAHPHLAGAVLDLANYLTREERVPAHPAQARSAELIALLGALVQRLTQIEEAPDAGGRTPREVGTIIAETLPLAVSLCDSLALIGDSAAIGKLHQAMELKHRRLRTEAAAALARLGDKKGEDILLELAAEPVARLRVLTYAQELKLLDRIDDVYQTDTARAESQLALYLAQPAQFGLPPTSLELIDDREMYWPSFNDPVDCYLFRFEYELGGARYANIGIAGPLEHAFAADLADLPPDDIYAAFAGWQAQHEDIREQDVSTLKEKQRVEVSRLERRLHDHGFESIVPVTLGSFFGERVLVATAIFDRHPGVAIVTGAGEITWLARNASSRPLGPAEAYCIFKGRRLLRTFNA